MTDFDASTDLKGVFPALITPFHADDASLDVAGLHALVDHCLAGGVDGFVVCGGSAEVTSLSSAERRNILEEVAKQSDGRARIIAHTGAMTTREALDLSAHAAEAGADALMVGLPYYEPISLDQVIKYFSTIAREVDLPIMAYNYPLATGVNLDAVAMARVAAEVPSVRYLKDSAGDLVQVSTAAIALHGRVGVFSGSDTQSCPGLLLGAVGMVNGASNVFPAAFVEMYRASARGEIEAVTHVWASLLPTLALLESEPFPSAVKSALQLAGVPVGPLVRAPAESVSPDGLARLERLMANLV